MCNIRKNIPTFKKQVLYANNYNVRQKIFVILESLKKCHLIQIRKRFIPIRGLEKISQGKCNLIQNQRRDRNVGTE